MHPDQIQVPELISDLADMVGGTIHEVGMHPGGESGFATMSFPLPEDHWLYERTEDGYTPEPQPSMLVGGGSKSAYYLERIIRPAVQYALRCATRCGRDDDFDPDCVLQQVRIGLFGYHTGDGTTHTLEEKGADYVARPPQIGDVLLEAIQLAILDGSVDAETVRARLSPEALTQAVERDTARRDKIEQDYQDLCKRKGWGLTEASSDAPVGYIAEEIGPAPDFGSDPPTNTSISLDKVQNLIQEAKKEQL